MALLHPTRRRRRAAALALVATLGVVTAACSSSAPSTSSNAPTTVAPGGSASATTIPADKDTKGVDEVVFNGEGNNLDAYAPAPGADGKFATQRVDQTIDTDPVHGRDINAQLCFLPRTKDGQQWFIAGEDTYQTQPGHPPGWGIFHITGNQLGKFEITQVGKLVPTFQPTKDGAENYGCGRLPDGRVLTTDVGNQEAGPGNGQLIVWFPPLTGGTYPKLASVSYCKIDVTLATAQSILVRGNDIYVAASRGDVYKYTGPFPTSNTAAGGCGKKDATGAPLATSVHRSVFIKAGPHGLATPAGLAPAPHDGFYVSSVISGVIDEFDRTGNFVQTVLAPGPNDKLGLKPWPTGSPLGIGVDDEGTLFYADIGIVVGDAMGPGDHTGTVRRIRFVGGKPQKPEIMATGVDFPDGIGIYYPNRK